MTRLVKLGQVLDEGSKIDTIGAQRAWSGMLTAEDQNTDSL
ncbi:MAG TPA: hypothetical protein VF221_10950 [Chloroflexota bacterium]